MRYVIFGVLIVLALVALMPVLISMGRHLRGYFNSAMNFEQDDEVVEEIEELEEDEKESNGS